MKKYRYKLNEADMEQLVDAIANKVEFSDEDVQASLVGNDMVISVFDKAVLILVDGEVPFIIEREDLDDEQQALVEEMYEALNISFDDEEESDEDLDGIDSAEYLDDIESDEDLDDTDGKSVE